MERWKQKGEKADREMGSQDLKEVRLTQSWGKKSQFFIFQLVIKCKQVELFSFFYQEVEQKKIGGYERLRIWKAVRLLRRSSID